MKRTLGFSVLPFVTALIVLSICQHIYSPPSLSEELVILNNDEPFIQKDSLSRGDLARILLSYLPKRLLVTLSMGREIPEANAPEDTMWHFLNRTGILPAFSDGSNHPEDTVRRNQLAIVLQNITRLLSIKTPEVESFNTPVDVDSLRYDAKPIGEILVLNLMYLDSLGRFRPDSLLTGTNAITSVVSLSKFTTTNQP